MIVNGSFIKKYKHWLIAGIIGFGTFGLLIGFNQSNLPVQSIQSIDQTPLTTDKIYSNHGPNAEDDSFFLPGTFQHLSELKDPTKPTVVWISASWCQTCQFMRPFIWKVANKYADRVTLKEIDFSDNYNSIVLPNYYFGTPTFVVLNTAGETVNTFYGADEQGFEDQIIKASLIQ